MSTTFSPRALYLKSHKDEAVNWALTVNTPECQNAMNAAFSEMAYSGSSDKELEGARKFIRALTVIADPTKPMSDLPKTKLEATTRHDEVPEPPKQ